MSTSLAGRSPTCLRCLRRTLWSGGASLISPLAITTTTTQVQVRGKKTYNQQADSGVVVRLLQDVPKFGRKDAIFRVQRGRMRNSWYPEKKAEYMTAARFSQLGLTRDAIGERDPLFGTFVPRPDDAEADAIAAIEVARRPGLEIKTISPERAAALLQDILPETLVFTRKPIQQQPPPHPPPTPSSPRSPLLAANATTSTGPSPQELQQQHKDAQLQLAAAAAIFGSVSTTDVAAAARELLLAANAEEAGLVSLEGARDVRFVGLADGADRVKTLGRWEVEISVSAGAAAAGRPVDPVRKFVEVVAGEHAGFVGAAAGSA